MNANPIIIAGPGYVKRGAAIWRTKSDITVDFVKNTREETLSDAGKFGETLLGISANIKFTPVAFSSPSVLFPFLAFSLGARLFGATNTPTEIYGADGKRFTFVRTAPTGAAAIGVGVSQSRIGEVTIEGLPDPAKEWTDESALYTIDEATFAAPDLIEADIISVPFVGIYGDVQFDLAEDTTITLEPTYSEDSVSRTGVFERTFGGYNVNISLTPANITLEDWLAIVKPQGETRRGGLLGVGTNYKDLVLRGTLTGDPMFTLKKAFVKPSALAWGANTKRLKAATFSAAGDWGVNKFAIGTTTTDIALTA